MKTRIFASLILISATALSVTLAEPWNFYTNPELMGRGRYTYDFDKLPLQGEVSNDKLPWSDTYWPTYKGGIAFRWQYNNPGSSWDYPLYSKDELLQMGPEKVARLSPAEKFDIMMGDYSYPTVRSERERTSPRADHWQGLCHGWTPAAINHREPQPKTITNQDGVEVRFGSSDIKAMLIYYYGRVNWKPVGWTGKRCRGLFSGGCRGVNPATLHLVMTNQLGLLNEAFIMDRDRGMQVWNQPFFSYTATKVGSCDVSRASRKVGAVEGVEILLRTKWGDELDYSLWNPSQKADAEGKVTTRYDRTSYQYCLELDARGKIVGGEWDSKTRPGYIWTHDVNDFAHPYYGHVKDLLSSL